MTNDRRRQDQSGWTVDTAMAHIESLLEEMDRRYQERFEAQEEAVKTVRDNSRDAQARLLALAAIAAAAGGSLIYVWNPLHH